MKSPIIRILGIRGIPAAHGGFETFAEYLSLFLVARGWEVIVYCQEDGVGEVHTDEWEGVKRIHIPINVSGAKGTMLFDWLSIKHATQSKELCLTLGYNTALFNLLLRIKGIPNLINMDGIEWARAKWNSWAKIWFYINEWAGCWLGNHLIADNPEIKRHLSTRVNANKITTIAYGAESVSNASKEPLAELALEARNYLTLIARPEPENSILEVVEGFSLKPRGKTLAVLGRFDFDNNPYHQAVLAAASSEVRFLGAIYNKEIVQAVRYHSLAYVHGHQVGGTNPSLVEALGAGNPVIAHDNRFNHWVAGEGARYFSNAIEFSDCLDATLDSPAALQAMSAASKQRFDEEFTWTHILEQYEQLLCHFLPGQEQVK